MVFSHMKRDFINKRKIKKNKIRKQKIKTSI